MGLRAFYALEWFQMSWAGTTIAEAPLIAVKELVPLVAVAVWGRKWAGSTVTCRCDNQAVVAVIM
jgi:hypothetical protein